MKNFIRDIVCLAFGLYAAVTSGAGASLLLEGYGYNPDKVALLILLASLLILAFACNGLKEFWKDINENKKR